MKKVIAVMFLCSLLTAALIAGTSCSGGADDANETQGDTQNQTGELKNTQAEETTEYLEAVDLGGRKFVVLNREVDAHYAYHIPEFTAETENGEPINDAVYKRNLFLDETYNIIIISGEKLRDNMPNEIKPAVLSGDDIYAAIAVDSINAFSCAANGYLHDIQSIPYIDAQNPWWIESMLKDTSIAGKNYFASGGANIAQLNATSCIYFNKNLIQDYSLEDPYTLVKENKWTADKLGEMAKAAIEDLNGDGIMNYQDKLGFLAGSWTWYHFFYGSNSVMIKKDENDIPYFASLNEREHGVLVKAIEMIDSEYAMNINRVTDVEATRLATLSSTTFSEDRGLFSAGFLYDIFPFRDMASDFGILPFPKYDEAQQDYISLAHPGHSSAMCVPITNSDLENTGLILEDMAYQSHISVRPAFYETTLLRKSSRDEESEEMLDIIYTNIRNDLGIIMQGYGINIDTVIRNAAASNDLSIISSVEKNIEKYNGIIKEVVEAFITGFQK